MNKNTVISWNTIFIILIACAVIAGFIVVFLAVNPTDQTQIARTCLQWAQENDCLCGITTS